MRNMRAFRRECRHYGKLKAVHKPGKLGKVDAGRASNEVGKRAEGRALTAINGLGWHWVKGARLATPAEDQAGIDIVVTTPTGELYVQVKSAVLAARRWRKKYPNLKAGVVVVRRAATDAEVRTAVSSTLITLKQEAAPDAPEQIE